MKILTAKDYGFRKVIRIAINDTDPEWVHPDGSSAPPGDTGDTEEGKEPGKRLCLDCRFNWDVREYQFEGDELTKLTDPDDDESPRIDKTDRDLMIEANTKAVDLVPAPVRDMDKTFSPSRW